MIYHKVHGGKARFIHYFPSSAKYSRRHLIVFSEKNMLIELNSNRKMIEKNKLEWEKVH